jgi:actin cytoskeleton-regulatory complex protein SLA1
VKALYDYEAVAPGELSVHEDDVLMLFDTEDDWILVQNSKAEGGAGYVPGNYVETMGDSPPPTRSRIIIPDSVSITPLLSCCY